MKRNKILLLISVITITLLAIRNWKNSDLNPNILEVNGFFIKKENTKYSAYYIKNPRSWFNEELIAKNIDSIIETEEYGEMIHGEDDNGKKKWFYIDRSDPTNVYGGFDDEDFRKDEIETIGGKKYLDSIVSINQFWNSQKNSP